MIKFLKPSEKLADSFNQVVAFEAKLIGLLGAEADSDTIMYSYGFALPLVPMGANASSDPMNRLVSFSVEELFGMFSYMMFRNDGVICSQFYCFQYNDVLFLFRADKGEQSLLEVFEAAKRDVAMYFAETSLALSKKKK